MANLIKINSKYLIIDASSKHKIGSQIIERREILSIPQEKLALLLNISIKDLITIEADMLLPDIEVLMNLSRILKCTTDYLLGRANKPYEYWIKQ